MVTSGSGTGRRRAPSPPRRQRACVPCTTAKARCNFQGENVRRHVCDRCEKLGVECTEKTTKSLRKPRQIKPQREASSMDIHIAHFSSTPTFLQSDKLTVSSASTIVDTPPPTFTPSPNSQSPHRPYASISHSPQPPTALSLATPPNGLTWNEAVICLNLYRQRYMDRLPGVYIQEHMTAQQLLTERPFVFRAVVLVAAPWGLARRKKMKRNVMAYLGSQFLVEGQQTFDLLQGLIVILTWNDLPGFEDTQINTLIYTALGMAHTLGLSKPPDKVTEHTIDEQRILVGLYSLLSVHSAQDGRRNPLNEDYAILCCSNLSRHRESLDDPFFSACARMFMVSEKIGTAYVQSMASTDTHSSNQAQAGFCLPISTTDGSTAVLCEATLNTLRAGLDEIWQSVEYDSATYQQAALSGDPSAVEAHRGWQTRAAYLSLLYNFLLVSLYEPATYKQGFGSDTFRASCLRNCLFAAKGFFDTLIFLSGQEKTYVPVTAHHCVIYVLTVATRLLFIDSAGWDVELARMTINFRGTVDRILEAVKRGEVNRKVMIKNYTSEMGCRLAATTNIYGQPEDEHDLAINSMLESLAQKVRVISNWYEAKVCEGGLVRWYQGDASTTVQGSEWDMLGMEAGLPAHGIISSTVPTRSGIMVPTAGFQTCVPGQVQMGEDVMCVPSGMLLNTSWSFGAG